MHLSGRHLKSFIAWCCWGQNTQILHQAVRPYAVDTADRSCGPQTMLDEHPCATCVADCVHVINQRHQQSTSHAALIKHATKQKLYHHIVALRVPGSCACSALAPAGHLQPSQHNMLCPLRHAAKPAKGSITPAQAVRQLSGCGIPAPAKPLAPKALGPSAQQHAGSMKHVVVIGGGVVGLTSALRLLQDMPRTKVTVLAHTMGWQTTSAGAAGLWGPYQIWDTPPDLVTRWAGSTLDHLYDLLYSSHASEAGISVRGVHLLQEEPAPPPSWSHIVDGWSHLSGRKLACLNKHKKQGPPFVQGWFYHSIACEGLFYMRWLQHQIQELGGEILLTPTPITHLSQLLNPDVQGSWQPAPAPPVASSQLPPNSIEASLTRSTAQQQPLEGLTLQEWLSQQPDASLSSPATPQPSSSNTSSTQQHQGSTRQFDAIINCTGIGARQLVNDSAVAAIRGQILRVSAPWITSAYLSTSLYVIPNNQSIVLGGTAQLDNWSLEASAADRLRIISGCVDMLPSLATARIMGDWVGLRPGRPSVRLELDKVDVSDAQLAGFGAKSVPVVHNYGHGGSGLTLAWGCAGDVVQMVKNIE